MAERVPHFGKRRAMDHIRLSARQARFIATHPLLQWCQSNVLLRPPNDEHLQVRSQGLQLDQLSGQARRVPEHEAPDRAERLRIEQGSIVFERRALLAPILHIGLAILAPFEASQPGQAARSAQIEYEVLGVVAGIDIEILETWQTDSEELFARSLGCRQFDQAWCFSGNLSQDAAFFVDRSHNRAVVIRRATLVDI